MAEKAHKNMKNRTRKHVLWRTYLLIGFAGTVVIGVMFYSFHIGARMAAIYSPLVDAAMEIRLEATTSHLWFEEMMGGDRHESIDAILARLDEADWYAKAMLQGGENAEGQFIPLKDSGMRQAIDEVRSKLAEFKRMTLERWKTRKISGIGTEIDQKYDAVYEDFVEQADIVETALQQLLIFEWINELLIAAISHV